MSCTYLAHHELESVLNIIITVDTIQLQGVVTVLQTGGVVTVLQTGGVVTVLQTGGVVTVLQTGGVVTVLQTGGVVTILQTGGVEITPFEDERRCDVDLSTLTTNAAGKLDVLGHDGDSLSVNGSQVGVLKQANQVGLSCLLES